MNNNGERSQRLEEPLFHLDKVKVANNPEFVTINNGDHKTDRFRCWNAVMSLLWIWHELSNSCRDLCCLAWKVCRYELVVALWCSFCVPRYSITQPLSLGGGQSRTSWITIRVNVKTLTELKVNVWYVSILCNAMMLVDKMLLIHTTDTSPFLLH